MASAFWTLEDGRTFSKRWTGMAYMLELITDELIKIEGATDFHKFLEKLVCREENGDIANGYGGFIRNNESIMFNFDLRTFTPKNRNHFWQAAQSALSKLKVQDEERNNGIVFLLTILLDMHKRINKGEDPMLLNDLIKVIPDPNEKIGPGWR